jgi:prephenate dehydratase
MPYQTRKVKYCHVTVPSRPGTGTRILDALKEENVNLLAFTGFPVGGRKAQVDLVTDDIRGLQRAARENDWRLSKVKKGFLVTGTDEVGVVDKVLARLADQDINVTAVDAVTAGKGRFGMIFWVNPAKYNKAARVLNAK